MTPKKVFLLSAAALWLLASCAGSLQPWKPDPSGKNSGAKDSPGAVPPVSPSAVVSYLDRQESDLHASLSQKDFATIERQENHLVVTFRSDVLFDVNSTLLKPGTSVEIVQLAQILKRYPETQVKICGHTDSSGSERYNQGLSERRAVAVRQVLVESGIHAERVSVEGLGESMPIASNATETGRQMNRRVTILLTPKSP